MNTSPIISAPIISDQLKTHLLEARKRTELLCQDMQPEDFVVQPIVDVSPTKWHLAHTTWFFETFLLVPYLDNYPLFHQSYGYLFNSYYESVGERVLRADRGNLTRPTTKEIKEYRQHVNQFLINFLGKVDAFDEETQQEIHKRLCIGINHEEQHQELLTTDIKYVLGHNPLFPKLKIPLSNHSIFIPENPESVDFVRIREGLYEIGHQEKSFCFDNEKGVHKVWLDSYQIATQLVSNREYLEFVESGAYQDFKYWLSEGWEFITQNEIQAPLYWHKIKGEWYQYTFDGFTTLDLDAPLSHISFYEAEAYAHFRGLRLPTEQEWEVAQGKFEWGKRWEWTRSAYAPYPRFKADEGALGEYNGKFMMNQMVLRGSSEATAPNHSRHTYRNFFHADKRWQYTGIRLVKDEN